MEQKVYINGNTVKYDDQQNNISYGIQYLQYDLKPDESNVFFNQAKTLGSAPFEDDNENQFTLQYNSNEYSYTLIKRDY